MILKLIVTCVGAGLVLQAIAFAVPGWMIIETEHFNFYMALWYCTSCVQTTAFMNYGPTETQCTTLSYHDLFRQAEQFDVTSVGLVALSEQQLIEWQVLATIALVSCLVGFVLSVKLYRKHTASQLSGQPAFNKKFAAIGILSCLLSGILMLIPVGNLAKGMMYIKRYSVMHEGNLNIGVPYGLIFAGLGAGLTSLAALLLLYAIVQHREGSAPAVPEEHPMVVHGPVMPPAQLPTGYDVKYTPYPQAQYPAQPYPPPYPGQEPPVYNGYPEQELPLKGSA